MSSHWFGKGVRQRHHLVGLQLTNDVIVGLLENREVLEAERAEIIARIR